MAWILLVWLICGICSLLILVYIGWKKGDDHTLEDFVWMLPMIILGAIPLLLMLMGIIYCGIADKYNTHKQKVILKGSLSEKTYQRLIQD
jgi:hypothetical protein